MTIVKRYTPPGTACTICGDKDGMPCTLAGCDFAQASAAPEQEAVAWLYSRPEGAVTPVVLLEKASDKDRGSWDETPLCTHADPAEVERLRAECMRLETSAAFWGRTAGRLQGKLAKAQQALENMLAAFDTPIARRKLSSAFGAEAIESARAFLSATAQPAEGLSAEEIEDDNREWQSRNDAERAAYFDDAEGQTNE